MYSVGLSSCEKLIGKKLFEEFSENEIREIEISEPYYNEFDYKNVYKLSKDYGVNLWSLHLPFRTFDISVCDFPDREDSVYSHSEIIKQGSDIGIDKFVVHPSSEPIDDAERSERMKHSKDSLSRLADVCEKCGAVLCVENLPRTCLGHSIDEMKTLLKDDARLKMCYDTNHITIEQPREIITAFADKIVTLHVSDFDFIDERHWLPGEGKINWQEVIKALGDIQYRGVFMYEIAYECHDNRGRGRDLRASDFTKNATELFSGSKLSLI